MTKLKFQTTPEERKIIEKLDSYQIEQWAKKEEYWRIYREVIKATKNHLKQKRRKNNEKSKQTNHPTKST